MRENREYAYSYNQLTLFTSIARVLFPDGPEDAVSLAARLLADGWYGNLEELVNAVQVLTEEHDNG